MPFTWNLFYEPGKINEVELCRNGLEVLITEFNKKEFVDKV